VTVGKCGGRRYLRDARHSRLPRAAALSRTALFPAPLVMEGVCLTAVLGIMCRKYLTCSLTGGETKKLWFEAGGGIDLSQPLSQIFVDVLIASPPCAARCCRRLAPARGGLATAPAIFAGSMAAETWRGSRRRRRRATGGARRGGIILRPRRAATAAVTAAAGAVLLR